MAFFPRQVMPLTPKMDSPKSTSRGPARITAEQYNLHDQEIRAIEEFLGTQPYSVSQGIPRQEVGDKATQSLGLFESGVLGQVGRLTERLNSLAIDGVSVGSGLVSSGGLIVFPQDIGATYLSSQPGPSDSEIQVASTAGFPSEGTISIANDVHQAFFAEGSGWQRTGDDVTTVEWIRYSGKTSTSFTGCQRGFLGTTRGPHAGNIEMPMAPTSTEVPNTKNVSVPLWQSMATVTTRRYRGWRNLTTYSLPILGLSGSKTSITDAVRLLASTFRVSAGYDPTQLGEFLAAANTVGILGTRDSGSYFLKSADGTHESAGTLEPQEALDFVGQCESRGLLVLESTPDQMAFPQMAVPVFRGKMGIGICPAVTGTAAPLRSVQVFLDAAGRLMMFSDEDRVLEGGPVGVIGYTIFHVPSSLSLAERSA